MHPPKQIRIAYKFIDGMHFFVPDDKEAAGLCVAHDDLRTAWSEVDAQLTVLLTHRYGESGGIKFEPEMPFDTFEKLVKAYLSAKQSIDEADVTVPSIVQPWMVEGPKPGL